LVAGVDEAGRGPLAGPVVAAAVILRPRCRFKGLHDSKLVAVEERERLYKQITQKALAWSVQAVDVDQIDTINILRATHLAMAQALSGLSVPPHHALVDGLRVSGLPCEHTAIVDGDALCVSIAAASIIAKVTRDRMMRELDREHPGYGFAQHKGYSTPEHYAALERLGPSPCHRRSFRPIAAFFATQGVLSLGDEAAAG
jgi:ribonuclease HII